MLADAGVTFRYLQGKDISTGRLGFLLPLLRTHLPLNTAATYLSRAFSRTWRAPCPSVGAVHCRARWPTHC